MVQIGAPFYFFLFEPIAALFINFLYNYFDLLCKIACFSIEVAI